MDLLRWLYEAQLTVGAYRLRWLEIVGVSFGLASAILGMRRTVWTWPIGIVGNVLLFFVYITVTFGADDRAPLFGQSGRQVFFVLTSLYGWWRWSEHRKARGRTGPAIVPRWATWRERAGLAAVWIGGVVLCQWVFAAIGQVWPAERWYYWFDAWIFMGSMIATYAMARGWVDFWLCWIAVDLVGVPLLLHSNYVPSAVLYACYAVFVVYGFTVWRRASREESADVPERRAAPVA